MTPKISRPVFRGWPIVLTVLLACGATSTDSSERSTIGVETESSEEAGGDSAMDGLVASELESISAWPSTPGLHRIVRELGGQSTRLSVHIPDGFDSQPARPLVVALHYGGEPTPHYGAGLLETIFIAGLAELDAVLIAPDTLEGGWVSAPNLEMLPVLFEEAFDAYSVDRERVLLAGYSMGGMGVWELAAADTLPITAALPVSGTPGNGLPTVPTHAVHSDADEVFELARVRGAIGYMQQAGTPAELTILSGLGHFDVAQHTTGVQTAAGWIAQQWGE